jgi:DNA-binding MarR family transcriptional regulator
MGKNGLIKEIIDHQRMINRFIRDYNPDVWMELSLTIAQMKSLFFIANEGTVNFRKLATALKVTPSNVTGIIDRLAEQGLVTRTENPDDRRMLMLQLTGKGETLISSLRERRASQMSSVLGRMAPEELAIVAQGFALVHRAIDNFEG